VAFAGGRALLIKIMARHVYVGMTSGHSFSGNFLRDVVKRYPPSRVGGVLFVRFPSEGGRAEYIHPNEVQQVVEELEKNPDPGPLQHET